MRLEDLGSWQSSFEVYCERFGGYFHRSETREQARDYVRGLLAPLERKTGWQLSETVGQKLPDRMQSLLSRGRWDEDGVRDELVRYVGEELGDPEGILILDETGFLKKGAESAGVQRQYSGTAGKIDNCQLGVFAAYSTARGHCLVDRRLYLPPSWVDDKARRKKAKIPEEVEHRSKAELGQDMVEGLREQGLKFRWVTGDEAYGDSRALRERLAELGQWYVLAVSCTATVFKSWPEVEEPEEWNAGRSRGRGRVRARVAEGEPMPVRVDALVAGLEADSWTPVTVVEGAKGPITYDWALVEVVECNGAGRYRLPTRPARLLVRRSQSDPSELAYYLSNAPASLSVEALALVAARRYVIEQCFREAKQDTGLDDYQVRRWGSWHRHITLSMLAMAWLTVIRYQAQQKGGPMSPRWLLCPSRRSEDSSPLPSPYLPPRLTSSSVGRSIEE